MTDDWYSRLLATGLLDVLAPYQPALVGVYPLGIAPAGAPVEIVCRATDLPAFGRVLEGAYGDREGFALYGGRLDEEPAVFAEFEIDGLPLEVSAQAEHLHRRLGAATLGISRALEEAGPVTRARLAATVAGGTDWLDAAIAQLNLSRSALESLSTANPVLVARVMGVSRPGPKVREYAIARRGRHRGRPADRVRRRRPRLAGVHGNHVPDRGGRSSASSSAPGWRCSPR